MGLASSSSASGGASWDICTAARLADITFPVRIREQLVAAKRAMLHHQHPESGWVSVPIRADEDVADIVALFRLSYDRPWLSPRPPSATPSPPGSAAS